MAKIVIHSGKGLGGVLLGLSAPKFKLTMLFSSAFTRSSADERNFGRPATVITTSSLVATA